jgi:hypothetical protein
MHRNHGSGLHPDNSIAREATSAVKGKVEPKGGRKNNMPWFYSDKKISEKQRRFLIKRWETRQENLRKVAAKKNEECSSILFARVGLKYTPKPQSPTVITRRAERPKA